jgi:hypothetical protein
MTITPFLTLKLRGKKDALQARQMSRRVANLLCFDPHEQACIAAGVFVVACQALKLLGKARLFFQIENNQLQVFTQEAKSGTAAVSANRITEIFHEGEPKSLFRLTKPLPAGRGKDVEELDLGWLAHKVEEAACNGMFEEIVKQNQEILTLLHELRLCRGNSTKKEEQPQNPHAA